MKKKLGTTVMDSLTLDNDISFTDHQKMAEELEATIYFCDPYKSYQKGGIENGNRLLRTKLPLQTDLSLFEQHAIDKIVDSFNQKPMKCLGYYTPHEVFYNDLELGHPKVRVALIP